MNEVILIPSTFTIGGKNYYFSSIFDLINGYDSSNFFEFLVFNDVYTRKILLWTKNKDEERSFLWILFLGEDLSLNGAKILINDQENKDILSFLNFVKENTPQALPYILFNYLN